jgi:hypothetical protein
MSKFVERLFYNIICAGEIMQTRIFGLGTELGGYVILRALVGIFTILWFALLTRLTGNLLISSMFGLIPIIYLIYFTFRDKGNKYEDAMAHFKTNSNKIQNIYYGAIILIFIILPASLLFFILSMN